MDKISKSVVKPDIDQLIAQGKGSCIIQRFLKERGQNISRMTIWKYIKARRAALARAKSNQLSQSKEAVESLEEIVLGEIAGVQELIREARLKVGRITSAESLNSFYSILCKLIELYNEIESAEKRSRFGFIFGKLKAWLKKVILGIRGRFRKRDKSNE